MLRRWLLTMHKAARGTGMILLGLTVILLLAGCRLWPWYGTNVSGQVASDFTVPNGRFGARAIEDLASLEIYVFSQADSFDTETYERVRIRNDGSFSFTVRPDHTFVALLVDPSQQHEKTLGVIGIGTRNDSYWELIDTSAVDGDLQLGVIAPSSDVPDLLISDATLAELEATVDEALAYQISVLDDFVRLAKNRINCGFTMLPEISHVFYTDRHNTVRNTWAPAGSPQWSGHQLTIWPDHRNGWPLTTGESVEIVPPSTVSFGDGTMFDGNDPCPAVWDTSEHPSIAFGYGETGEKLFQQYPPGYWQLRAGGELLALLDFGCSAPIDDEFILLPQPIIRVNTEPTSDRITSVEVEWYGANGRGEYVPLETQVVSQAVNFCNLDLIDLSVEPSPRYSVDDIDQISGPVPIAEEWYLSPNPPGGHYADYIHVVYQQDGVIVRFAVREF